MRSAATASPYAARSPKRSTRPGPGHVAALERLILELRGARASPAAFTAAAEATGSPPLRTAARVYQAVADIPSPDAPEWETVDAARVR